MAKLTRNRAGARWPLMVAVLLAVLAMPARATLPSATPAVPSLALHLTPAEEEYLAGRGPVRVCADPSYHPFDFIDAEGRHRGIAADLLQEIAALAGFTLELVPTSSWAVTMQRAERGECDVVAMLNETPARAEFLSFTRPYLRFENAIVTHRPAYHRGLASLAGETLALPAGFRVIELIATEHPDIAVVEVANLEAALRAVSQGEADATLVNPQRLIGDIQRLHLRNVYFAGDAELQDVYRFGVRKGDDTLLGILDRGLEQLPADRVGRSLARWYVVPVEQTIDWSLVLTVAGVALAVVALLLLHLFHQRRFRQLLEGRNRELQQISETDSLTQTANRRKLNLRLHEELERARRHRRPLAVILFDVDQFKEINDHWGHLAGDTVLVELAGVARQSLRRLDVLGRWGGDELLVLCPECALGDALALAERLRQEVEGHQPPTGPRLTVSLGVSEREEGDTIDSLLRRADEALYRAKAGGRNRVESCQGKPADTAGARRPIGDLETI